MSGTQASQCVRAHLGTIALGLATLVVAFALPVDQLVDRFIVTRQPELAAPVHQGIRLFQLCLGCIGLIVCAWPVLRRFLWSDDARQGKPLLTRVPDATRVGTVTTVVALGALLVLGSVVRFRHIDLGLTYDEINAAEIFFDRKVSAVPITYSSSNNHIFYSLCANISGKVFGKTDLGYRLPAIVFGLASIVAVWYLAAHVLTRRDALVAAALICFSYRHIWFSQEARGYTALMLYGTLGLAQFVRALRTGRTRDWVLYAAAMLIAVYTHLFAAFLVAGSTLGYLCVAAARRELRSVQTRRVLTSAALIALGTCTLYSVVMPQMWQHYTNHLAIKTTHPLAFTWRFPVDVLHSFVLGHGHPVLTLAFGLLALTGFVSIASARPGTALFLVMPALLAMAALGAGGTVACTRYFLFFLPSFLVLVARGVVQVSTGVAHMASSRTGRALAGGLAGVCLLVGLLADHVRETIRYQTHGKQAFRQAADWLGQARRRGDRILTVGLGKEKFAYYLNGTQPVQSVEELRKSLDAPGTVWVVYAFPERFVQRGADMCAAVREHCQPALRVRALHRWGDVEIWCRPAAQATVPTVPPPPSRPSRRRSTHASRSYLLPV